MISVNRARRETRRRLTATIRREVESQLAALYAAGRRDAELRLLDNGEKDAARALPDACPYAFDDLLADEWWPTNRHGLAEEG